MHRVLRALASFATSQASLGARERDWLDWLPYQVPEAGLGLLVPVGARMVIVAPHPDDEVLGVGGLIANAAAAHRKMFFVAVSRGTASYPGSATWTTDRLAVEREKETLAGLRALGVVDPKIIHCGFKDGELASSEHALTLLLKRLLGPADVVFTTWREDGKPDHDAVGRACALAVAAVGCSLVEFPVWAWQWARVADAKIPWNRAIRFQLAEEVQRRKYLSIAAHRSQVVPDRSTRRSPLLSPAIIERFTRPFEVMLR